MDEIPAWALEKEKEIFSQMLSSNPKHQFSIARALVAERERAAKIVEAKRGSVPDWPGSEMAKINAYTPVDVSRATSKVLIEQLAAEIRKGE